jgi:hypothetical protein
VARPKKQTVDYFPHSCKHGKTMFIIEQKYGNDGYAFWFKLLELLGSSEGHYLKLENPADWEYLTATTRLEGETCEEILNLLAKLEAIDPDAWEKRIVWSDNFIENVKEAYRNRIVDTPVKPDCLRKNNTSEGITNVRNSQSIVDEMKVDESIVEEGPKDGPPPIDTTENEKLLMGVLKKISNYPFAYSKDLEFIRQLSVEFPELQIMTELQKYKTYKLDKPLTKKSNARLQIRNWMENAVKFSAERSNNGPYKNNQNDPPGEYEHLYN